MDERQTNTGEMRTRNGVALGRLAAVALACFAVLASQVAMGQARSSSGGEPGARGLGGAVVQFEETAGRAILYHEEQGSLVINGASPLERADGSAAAASKAAAPKAPSARGPATEPPSTNGAPPLRSPQRKAVPAEGVAMRP